MEIDAPGPKLYFPASWGRFLPSGPQNWDQTPSAALCTLVKPGKLARVTVPGFPSSFGFFGFLGLLELLGFLGYPKLAHVRDPSFRIFSGLLGFLGFLGLPGLLGILGFLELPRKPPGAEMRTPDEGPKAIRLRKNGEKP